jgi:hypothetical protein
VSQSGGFDLPFTPSFFTAEWMQDCVQNLIIFKLSKAAKLQQERSEWYEFFTTA